MTNEMVPDYELFGTMKHRTTLTGAQNFTKYSFENEKNSAQSRVSRCALLVILPEDCSKFAKNTDLT
jgi:hypothetical protein